MAKIHLNLLKSSFKPVCIDNIDNKLSLQNVFGDTKGSSLSLMITKCKGEGCASGDEINRYIDRLYVTPFGVYDILQFTNRVGKPVFQ